jgi:hypothetical protein
MGRRCTKSLTRHVGDALVATALGSCWLVGCTSRPVTSTRTTVAVTTTPPRAPAAVHPSRDAVAAALPTTEDLTWLPSGTVTTRDVDVSEQLGFVGCSAAPHLVAGHRATTTNIAFERDGVRVATITFYDVDSVDDATQFMSGTRAFLRCPNQGAPVSTSLLPLATPTTCDDTLALRTRQPEASTIDAWCRVGNLIGWIRLGPRGGVAPTDADGVSTIDAVGARLGSLFA